MSYQGLSRRSALGALVLVGGVWLSENAIAAELDSVQVDSQDLDAFLQPSRISIDGHVFVAGDDLQWVTGGEVLGVSSSMLAATPMGYKPYEDKTVYNGTSWVRNQQIALLEYVGTARAMANIVGSQRVIQARITYSRDGVVLGSAVSSARGLSGKWTAGYIATTRQFDTLKSNAPVTTYNWSWGLISSSALP